MRYLLSIAILVFCAGCGEKKKTAAKVTASSKPATKSAPGPGQGYLPGPFGLKRSIENDMRQQNKEAQQRNAILNELGRRN